MATLFDDPKDPDAVLDYKFDWSTWLDTDTISSYTITASGVTVDSDSNTDTVVTVWLSGGTEGDFASVACRIVTAGSRTDERTAIIEIANR